MHQQARRAGKVDEHHTVAMGYLCVQARPVCDPRSGRCQFLAKAPFGRVDPRIAQRTRRRLMRRRSLSRSSTVSSSRPLPASAPLPPQALPQHWQQ